MSPAEEEKSLAHPRRCPRASKFALSACAVAVAELDTLVEEVPAACVSPRPVHRVAGYNPATMRFRVHHAFMKILSQGGIRGLWTGWVPNVQRAALVNVADLTTYNLVKHFLLMNTPLVDNSVTHSVARGLLYKSSVDCLTQTVQGEGFMSLYKGFIPIWMRMVLTTAIAFTGTLVTGILAYVRTNQKDLWS